jgi:ketosteroid isomerase-like protein
MESELLAKARAALTGWQQGDLTALEPLLDPDVELLWWEPGDWDCHGREAVLAVLRDRRSRGSGRAAVDLIEVGDDTLVVARKRTARSGPAAGMKPATLVTFREDNVVSMRQFRSRAEALAAAAAKEPR